MFLSQEPDGLNNLSGRRCVGVNGAIGMFVLEFQQVSRNVACSSTYSVVLAHDLP
jgi:hypothetical protein